jgi:hypothetical protein
MYQKCLLQVFGWKMTKNIKIKIFLAYKILKSRQPNQCIIKKKMFAIHICIFWWVQWNESVMLFVVPLDGTCTQ